MITNNKWLIDYVEKYEYSLDDMKMLNEDMIETSFTHKFRPPITLIMNRNQIAMLLGLVINKK